MKRSPFKRKPRGPNKAGSNLRYLAWVRTQPCCICHKLGAEAHHLILTGKGMGLKTPDEWAIPLCVEHHHQLHNFRGFFETFTKERRAEWQVTMSMTYRSYKPTAEPNEDPMSTDPWLEIF